VVVNGVAVAFLAAPCPAALPVGGEYVDVVATIPLFTREVVDVKPQPTADIGIDIAGDPENPEGVAHGPPTLFALVASVGR
jgi:hypothetical protein